MRLGLGIDTGGTYTDAVLYDFDAGAPIVSVKARTTHENLLIGIQQALDGLPGELLDKSCLTSLSTTLATNACVEGKGCRAALVLMGYDQELFSWLGQEYGLRLQREHVHFVAGCHTQRGEPGIEPDWDHLAHIARSLRGRVDAVGIAEYWGIRNPEYERRAADLLRELTGLPVAVASDLSTEINSLRRAATTYLNARLIPLLCQLLDAVREALDRRRVSASLMVVRGDGSLMAERFARERPVETLLSGPAASVLGGMRLSGIADGILVDIGGTTTDIAVVRGGRATLVDDGVEVGAWRTGTRAIGIRTIGLGGDSRIAFDKQENLTLGPGRVLPLCMLAKQHPRTLDTLERMRGIKRKHALPLAEFFCLMRDPEDLDGLSAGDARIVAALAGGPLPLLELSERLGERPYFLGTQHLEERGIVLRSALTPTDLMHVQGRFTEFRAEASTLGLQILADRLDIPAQRLIERVFQIASRKLYRAIAEFMLARGRKRVRSFDAALLDMGFEGDEGELDVRIHSRLPLVGIGAPVESFLPDVARRFGAQCLIPSFSGVANAVGAITGSILAEETVLVRPNFESWGVDGYSCHGRQSHFKTDALEDALEWARDAARGAALEASRLMGATDAQIAFEEGKSIGSVGGEGGQPMLMEVRITARAIGKAPLA